MLGADVGAIRPEQRHVRQQMRLAFDLAIDDLVSPRAMSAVSP
jgi:hypothetical protein